MRTLLTMFVIIAFLGTIVSAIMASYLGVRASANIATGGPHRWIVKVNRLNAVLFADELSPAGQQYRRRYLKATVATVCSIAVLAVLAFALALTK